MALLFEKSASLTDNFVVADPTTDVKIHICHFDDESERCNVSKRQQLSKSSSATTVKFTIILITRGI
jgi:hypothetical protein